MASGSETARTTEQVGDPQTPLPVAAFLPGCLYVGMYVRPDPELQALSLQPPTAYLPSVDWPRPNDPEVSFACVDPAAYPRAQVGVMPRRCIVGAATTSVSIGLAAVTRAAPVVIARPVANRVVVGAAMDYTTALFILAGFSSVSRVRPSHSPRAPQGGSPSSGPVESWHSARVPIGPI